MKKIVNDEYNIIAEWKTDDIERLISELQVVLEDRYSIEGEQEKLAHEIEAQIEEQAKGEYEEQQQAQDEAEYYAQRDQRGY